jgi:hypothetical protein
MKKDDVISRPGSKPDRMLKKKKEEELTRHFFFFKLSLSFSLEFV